MTYHDSADDDRKAVYERPWVSFPSTRRPSASVAGWALATVAKLWHVAVQGNIGVAQGGARVADADVTNWLVSARANGAKLVQLLDAIHGVPLPEPSGTYDSMIEFERRRGVKERLLFQAIHTAHDTFLAWSTLQGVSGSLEASEPGTPTWGPLAAQLERALLQGDAAAVRKILPGFLALFRDEPIVFTAPSEGGDPRRVLRARVAQSVLRALTASMPRLGLLRETFQLVRSAHAMEQAQPVPHGVSQFNELFGTAFQAIVEAVAESSQTWNGIPPAAPNVADSLRESSGTRGASAPQWSPLAEHAPADRQLAGALERIAMPFLKLWVEHGQSLRLSHLEISTGGVEECALRPKYGKRSSTSSS